MASKAATAPEVKQTATAYLIVKGAARAIEFYKQAFGATEIMRLNGPGDRIGHAEIRIGNSTIMLADEFPDYGVVSAETLGGSPVRITLQVPDVDAMAARAIGASTESTSTGAGSVLWRTLRPIHQSLRTEMDHRNAQGNTHCRRDREAVRWFAAAFSRTIGGET